MRVDVATGASRVLDTATGFESLPCWTEGGAIVAARTRGSRREYVEYRGSGTRRRVRAIGTAATPLMFGPGCANFAEGPLPVDSDDAQLTVRPLRGGAPVATLRSSWPVGGLGLAWSADGRLIADIDDTEPKPALRVTDVTTGDVVSRVPTDSEFARIPAGAFSPDGTSVLVRQYVYEGRLSEIATRVFDVAAGTFRDLVRHRLRSGTKAPGPEAWSPRGDLIAVVQAQELHLYDPAGNDLGTVGAGSKVKDMVWSPDGSRLAVQRLGALRPGSSVRVYARDVAVVAAEPGARARTVFRDMAKDSRPAWSPDGRRLALLDD